MILVKSPCLSSKVGGHLSRDGCCTHPTKKNKNETTLRATTLTMLPHKTHSIVVDSGTFSTKAGFSGDESPQLVLKSVLGKVENDTTTFFGDDLDVRRDRLALHSPFRNGLVCRWDIMESIWDQLFQRLSVNSKDTTVLLAEPSHNARVIREKHTELLFEKKGIRSLFMGKSAAWSCYANARGTGVVLDSGGGSTSVCTVAEGYVLPKSIIRDNISGRTLDKITLELLSKRRDVKQFYPKYSYQKTVQADGSTRIEPTSEFDSRTHKSYRDYMLMELGREIRESFCVCSHEKFDLRTNSNIPSKRYRLPDNTTINIGTERFLVPELMFNPTLHEISQSSVPVHTMILMSIEKCGEQRLRKELFGNLIVTGGNTAYEGFKERVEREITLRAANSLRSKVVGGSSKTSKCQFTPWMGGSILGSMDSFEKMFITKKEYEECGASVVGRKCP